MRLTDQIALIGSGGVGFNLTHPLDCHIYLIHDGDAAAQPRFGAHTLIVVHVRRSRAIASAITRPWKRPFSMKISFVCIPATMTPAR